jgi:hypothetical protein
MALDFEYFYKCPLPVDGVWPEENEWDVFISAFNASERVNTVFAKVKAKEKYWLVFPEYKFEQTDYPKEGQVFESTQTQESEFIQDFIEKFQINFAQLRVAVDITGFMRPHLLYIVRALQHLGLRKVDMIYSEPGLYKKKEETTFSDGPVVAVRPITGFEGQHDSDSSNDLLLLGIGYDHELVKQVREYKEYAALATLWAFPSLRADMYQESVLRASRAEEAAFTGDWKGNRYFAIANDPFATANALRRIVKEQEKRKKITNLYLSPLATKPQALGFAIFYLCDWRDQHASIIFPFAEKYAQETSTGISKIWKYTIDFAALT